MSGTSRFAIWLLTTLAVSSLVHLTVVFALPRIGTAVQIEAVMPTAEGQPTLYVDDSGELAARFRFADRRQDSAFCAFDLSEGAVRVRGTSDFPYWSISVHTRSGLVVGSVNNRAASAGVLELLIMLPALAQELSEAGAILPAEALVVEMDEPIGIARISGLAPYRETRPELRRDLEETQCELATFTFLPPEEDNPDDAIDDTERPAARQEGVPSPVPRPE